MPNLRSIIRPRFSLRLLLLCMTAFAIGFPIWWRWPYQKISSDPIVLGTGESVQRTIVSTWQRQWNGRSLRSGPERCLLNGETIGITTYRAGKLHGPYLDSSFEVDGAKVVRSPPTTTGQYDDDKREGVWTYCRGGTTRTMTWHHDLLDGPGELDAAGRKISLMFAHGRLTQFDGKPAANRLFDLLETKDFGGNVRWEMAKPTELSFVETPLSDVLAFISERHGFPIELDEKVRNPSLPITETLKGVDLLSALTLITSPRGLGCDYRFGSVWITTAEDAMDWHDPTEVSQIEPQQHSELARAWYGVADCEAIKQPLVTELRNLAQRMAITIDTTPIESAGRSDDLLITCNAKATWFANVLGKMLYGTGCRCKLDGDKLVILPPEGKGLPPAKGDIPTTN